MKRAHLLPVVVILLGAGCATVHPGNYAIPLDMAGGYRGPTTALGLVISGREITRLATPSVGAVEVTIENRSADWIHIGRVALDFQNQEANQLVTTPPDADAANWAQAVAQRDAIELTNRNNALAGVAVAGGVAARIAGGSSHHHRSGAGAIGAVVALGALLALTAMAVDDDVQRAEQVSFLPQNHLLVAPFGIPPGLFVKKWIALTTAAPGIPCLDAFILAYDTTAGRHERVRLQFRTPDGTSSWQRATCARR
jgi:hypothetical protein